MWRFNASEIGPGTSIYQLKFSCNYWKIYQIIHFWIYSKTINRSTSWKTGRHHWTFCVNFLKILFISSENIKIWSTFNYSEFYISPHFLRKLKICIVKILFFISVWSVNDNKFSSKRIFFPTKISFSSIIMDTSWRKNTNC